MKLTVGNKFIFRNNLIEGTLYNAMVYHREFKENDITIIKVTSNSIRLANGYVINSTMHEPITSNGIMKGMNLRYIGPINCNCPDTCIALEVDTQYNAVFYKEGLSCDANYWEIVHDTVEPTAKEIETNSTQQKETTMNSETPITITMTADEYAKHTATKTTKYQTELESRKPWATIEYTVEGNYVGVSHHTSEKKARKYAKKFFQSPAGLGRTIVIHKEVGSITTNIPLVSTKS